MVFKVALFGLLYLVCISQASVIPTVKVLQGPSSKTVLLGPDGGAIDSAAPGGTVVTDDHGSGLVAAGPAALPLGPEIIVNGPAGSIATSYTAAGPAVVPAVSPVAVAPAISLGVIPIVGGPLGDLGDNNGNEGAYIPDNAEGLYDDGSYRKEYR